MKKTAPPPDKLADLLARCYPVTLYPEVEGGYTAQIEQLPGCISQGETLEEAMTMINDARHLWIETALATGIFVPTPVDGAVRH
jgi:predicted RNase H-like HicB family nuclease